MDKSSSQLSQLSKAKISVKETTTAMIKRKRRRKLSPPPLLPPKIFRKHSNYSIIQSTMMMINLTIFTLATIMFSNLNLGQQSTSFTSVEASPPPSSSSSSQNVVVVDTDLDHNHHHQLKNVQIRPLRDVGINDDRHNKRRQQANQLLRIKPLLRITKETELILELSLPNLLTESIVLNNCTTAANIDPNTNQPTLFIKLTAILMDLKSNNITANGKNLSETAPRSSKIDFWSENFVYTEQKSLGNNNNNNNNKDIYETIQLHIDNPNDYYSNNITEPLLKTTTNQKNNDPKLCQLFNGFIMNCANTKTIEDGSVATITICNDGTMNGLVTLLPYGQIVLETYNAQPLPQNNHETVCPIRRKSVKGSDLVRLEVCSHCLKFIRFPHHHINLMAASNGDKKMLTRWTDEQEAINMKKKSEKQNSRRKRSYSSERTIEILVVTDLSMYLYHGNSLRSYVFTLMAMVSHLFKHSSIGNEINIKLVKLTSLVDEKQEKNWFGSAHKTLRHFCRWQYEHNHPSDDHPTHHDTAILLTKLDLCSKNEFSFNEIDGDEGGKIRPSCDTLGLAHSGQICDPESSCAIVEDNGLSAAFTIAHELGHLLGVPHDDEERCKKFYIQTAQPARQEYNVMVRMIDSTSHMWSWSSCSKHFITEFLDSGHGDCLLDNNAEDVRHSSEVRVYETYQRRSFLQSWIDKLARLPAGALYSADEQCRLVFDKNSSICLDMPFCKKLWCTTTNSGGCRTQHMPWADGTECGNGFWCQEGECVRINRAQLRPIDGGWGDWSQWSQCSLSCGGGIRRSRRECDNPSPKFGGKFCLGERVKYESCNLTPCPYQSTNDDARAQQCAEFNTYNLTWTPKYTGIPSSDICALYCESSSGESHKLKSRVVDGTLCLPDSYDICVNGKCLSAGCDRILGSNLHTDNCGVCGGDNSTCREISGQFKPRSVSHGYTFVLSIPPGAINVEILKEPSIASDNWLALRDEYGEYLLNGRFTVNVYERKWYYGGATVEYSGTKKHGFERINISRPIQRPLNLEMLCVGELHVPTINYHYVVTEDNAYVNYQWISETDWSQCNKACNGEQERKPYCVAIIHPSWLMDNSPPMITQTKVKEEYCGFQTRPDTEYRVCNSHCELEWHTYQTSPCSTKCGHGFRSRQINCTQTFINHSERVYIDDFYCYHLGPKPSDRENCTANECRVTYQWQYTDWSACDLHQSTCGSGQQNRVAHCLSTTYLDSDSSNVIHSNVGQELCVQHLPEPTTIQSCQVECPRWNILPWSECSGSCGKSGQRSRSISCFHGDQQVNDAYCEALETKPIERMACQMPDCLPLDSAVNDRYHSDLNNRTKKVGAPEVGFLDAEESVNDNEIVYHGIHHHMGVWKSGEWSSCETFHDHLEQFQNRLVADVQTPKCFESIDQRDSFWQRNVHLFKLNESLHSNSSAQLASLMNLDEQNLKRRRYVACVLSNSQQVLPDSECDDKNKPKSQENCPVNERIRRTMSRFDIQLCAAEGSSTTVDSISYEIEPKAVDLFDDSSVLNHYKINDKIKWTHTEWTDCFCDPERKTLIRKRMIVCVRRVDGRTINDEYCLQNQLLKPKDQDECSDIDHHYLKDLNCDPHNYRTDDYSATTPNSTTIQQVSNTNSNPGQSALLPSYSHYTYYSSSSSSEPMLKFTPIVSSLSSTSKPSIIVTSSFSTSSSLSLPIIPNLQTVSSLDETAAASFDPITESPALSPSYSLSSSSLSPSSHNIESSTLIPKIAVQTPIPNQIVFQPSNGGWSEWTEWNECSVSCGNGMQSRQPRCPNGKQCEERLKPRTQYRSCYRMCGFFQWHYSEWSPCSVSCGSGFRTRNSECRDWTGFPVPDRFCENKQLILKEECRMVDCKLVWRSGQWSECSQSCGPGLQSRSVTCHRINKHGVIDPQPLDHSNSILRRKRKEHFKPKRKSRRKKLKIARKNRQTINYSEKWCDSDSKPSSTKICNLGNCLQSHIADAYVWRTFDWQMCSTPCGFGYQRRKVHCYSLRTNGRVDRNLCDPKFKPDKRRQCSLRSCEVISCQDRRDRARTRIDGEYELWIQGAMVRVFCYGMDYLPKPLEYLVLNENTFEDNYSQLTTIGSRDCSHHSSNYVHQDGRFEVRKLSLNFKHVRFDASTLEIYANDTRYAVASQDSTLNTLGTNERIGYGQAFLQGCSSTGYQMDHPNSINCHYGADNNNNHQTNLDHHDGVDAVTLKSIFSINLQKTGIVVDHDNHWIVTGNDYGFVQKNIQISRNGEKIIGHCSLRTEKLPITVPSISNCLIGCQPMDNIIKVRIP